LSLGGGGIKRGLKSLGGSADSGRSGGGRVEWRLSGGCGGLGRPGQIIPDTAHIRTGRSFGRIHCGLQTIHTTRGRAISAATGNQEKNNEYQPAR
jgi:hypothetical protein